MNTRTQRNGQNLQRLLFGILPYAVILFAMVQFWTVQGAGTVDPYLTENFDSHKEGAGVSSVKADHNNQLGGDKAEVSTEDGKTHKEDTNVVDNVANDLGDGDEPQVSENIVPDAIRVAAAVAGVVGSSAMGGACCGCCLQKGKQGAGCCNWCCKCCDATLDTCCPCCDEKCCHNCCKPCAKQCKCCKGCCIGCPECCGCDPECGCCRRCRACCPCCCEKHDNCEPHCEEPKKHKDCEAHGPECDDKKGHFDDDCCHDDHYMPHDYII